MEIITFERMIRESSLNHTHTLPILLRFLVSYHTASGRVQTDMLAFGRTEFEEMTEEEAIAHIRACEKRLLDASVRKFGRLDYEMEHEKAPVAMKPVVHFTNTAINYPAH
jgi:hypothetical protein